MSTTRPELSERTESARSNTTVTMLAVIAVFVALSAVGSLVKIPSPLGTVAFDSAPGFFVGIAFGGVPGAIVALIGHLITAAMTGFPLTLPMHLIIAVGMGLCAWAFGVLGRRGNVGLVIGFVVAAVLNSFVLGLIVLPIGGVAMYTGMSISLLVGAIANLAVATIAYLALRNTRLLRR